MRNVRHKISSRVEIYKAMSRMSIQAGAAMIVNKKRCATCPFNKNGDREIRAKVETRVMSVSQLCHHTSNLTLCRGARDHQMAVLVRMGMLDEPTDEAWNRKCEELGIKANNIKGESDDR
jgi:hypothetical protein